MALSDLSVPHEMTLLRLMRAQTIQALDPTIHEIPTRPRARTVRAAQVGQIKRYWMAKADMSATATGHRSTNDLSRQHLTSPMSPLESWCARRMRWPT